MGACRWVEEEQWAQRAEGQQQDPSCSTLQGSLAMGTVRGVLALPAGHGEGDPSHSATPQPSSPACRARCEWCCGWRWKLSSSSRRSQTAWMGSSSAARR